MDFYDFYNYGLLGLFAICFIASSLFPLGSEAFVIGFLALGFKPALVLVVASIGNILGSLSTYYLAYFGGTLALQRFFAKSQPKLEAYAPWVRRHGALAAFLSFLPFIGDVLVLLLGLYRYSPLRTWIFISLGKVARYSLLIYLYALLDIDLS